MLIKIIIEKNNLYSPDKCNSSCMAFIIILKNVGTFLCDEKIFCKMEVVCGIIFYGPGNII